MKIKLNGLVSLLLALVLCALVCVSCAKGKDVSEETTTATEAATTEDLYDANGYLKDDLPESADYGGKTLTVYMWSNQKQWEFVDTSTYPTVLLDQALYTRETNVESRFNIKIEYVTEAGDWDNRNKFIQTLANSVNVNDKAFDLVGQYTPCVGIGTTQGLYQDLATVDNINTSKPWWPTHMVSSSTVSGKVYGITGDISPTLIRNVQCMFVNLDLYESYNIAQYVGGRTIYDVVRDYDWTLDTFKKLALDHVGSDEGIDNKEKMYGFSIINNVGADGFLYAGGYKMVEDSNGKIKLSDDLTSVHFSDWFDAVQGLFNGKRADIFKKGSEGLGVFIDNRAVFYTGSISESQTLAQKGAHFSILPMPMRNIDQGMYYTCANMWVTMFSIPIDVKDTALSGLLMEALASEAYRSVTDTVYYNLFQTRYNSTGNEDSAEMFDIVSDSVVFDTSRIFADALKSFAVFRNAVNDPEQNWSSTYSSQSTNLKGNVTSLIALIG